MIPSIRCATRLWLSEEAAYDIAYYTTWMGVLAPGGQAREWIPGQLFNATENPYELTGATAEVEPTEDGMILYSITPNENEEYDTNPEDVTDEGPEGFDNLVRIANNADEAELGLDVATE